MVVAAVPPGLCVRIGHPVPSCGGRVVRGMPLLLAVAIFATSFHPIIHAADVKPYASDLLAALVLLALAVEWIRVPERAGWMWALAVIAPICIALSHPAIFVAGGIVVGLLPAVVSVRDARGLDRLRGIRLEHGRHVPRALSRVHARAGGRQSDGHADPVGGGFPAAG